MGIIYYLFDTKVSFAFVMILFEFSLLATFTFFVAFDDVKLEMKSILI